MKVWIEKSIVKKRINRNSGDQLLPTYESPEIGSRIAGDLPK